VGGVTNWVPGGVQPATPAQSELHSQYVKSVVRIKPTRFVFAANNDCPDSQQFGLGRYLGVPLEMPFTISNIAAILLLEKPYLAP